MRLLRQVPDRLLELSVKGRVLKDDEILAILFKDGELTSGSVVNFKVRGMTPYESKESPKEAAAVDGRRIIKKKAKYSDSDSEDDSSDSESESEQSEKDEDSDWMDKKSRKEESSSDFSDSESEKESESESEEGEEESSSDFSDSDEEEERSVSEKKSEAEESGQIEDVLIRDDDKKDINKNADLRRIIRKCLIKPPQKV